MSFLTFKKPPTTLSERIRSASSSFAFNPFGGLDEYEVLKILVPKFDLYQLADEIKQGKPQAIQFIGRHGRGKSTHLRALRQFFSPKEAQFWDLPLQELPAIHAPVLFIDGIQHLSLSQRLSLWKKPGLTLIFTTHLHRRAELAFSNKPLRTFRFKGISAEELSQIISNRLQNAMLNEESTLPAIKPAEVDPLISHFGDDFRGILNYLYTYSNQTTP